MAVAALHTELWLSPEHRKSWQSRRQRFNDRHDRAAVLGPVRSSGAHASGLVHSCRHPRPPGPSAWALSRSALAGKCSARYLAPRYCTLLNHTQGISHKPLRRAGAFQAAAYSRRTAPSAIGESVGTEFCATTASRAAVSRAVDSCSSRLCSEAAARRAQEAGLFPRIRRRRVWRSRGVTRREQSARGAEQQGCHCAPCTRRANVPLVCKVRSCLRRSCCLPCGSHFFDPTGLQNKLPGCRLVTLVLFFAGLGGSTVQS